MFKSTDLLFQQKRTGTQPTKDRARRPKRSSGTGHSSTIKSTTSESQMAEKPSSPVAEKKASFELKAASTLPDSKIGRLTEQWMNAGPIIPKASSSNSSQDTALETPSEPKPRYTGIRQALPGMAKVPEPRKLSSESVGAGVTRSVTPQKSFDAGRPGPINVGRAQSFDEARTKSPVPPSPGRIPTTGSRPTVMEVAQAFTEHSMAQANNVAQEPRATTPSRSPALERKVPAVVEAKEKDREKEKENEAPAQLRSPIPRPSPSTGAAEKRRSTYDSFITLPPLAEEVTPVATPSNTLSRSEGRNAAQASVKHVSEVRKTERNAEKAEDTSVVQLGKLLCF